MMVTHMEAVQVERPMEPKQVDKARGCDDELTSKDLEELLERVGEIVSDLEYSDQIKEYCSVPEISPYELAALVLKRLAHDHPDAALLTWDREKQLDFLAKSMSQFQMESVDICQLFSTKLRRHVLANLDAYPCVTR